MGRLRLWRRLWCLRRGHPMASWSPVVFLQRDLDGTELVQRAWRCALHDKEEGLELGLR